MSYQQDGMTPLKLVSQVRTMQIIIGALVMGALIFAATVIYIVYFLDQAQNLANPNGVNPVGKAEFSIIAMIAVIFTVMEVAVRLVLPGFMIPQQIKECIKGKPFESIVKDDLVPAYQSVLIVKAALLEGVVFFNLIAFYVDHQLFSLGLAGLLIVWIATDIPTIERVDNWIEEQLRTLQLNPPDKTKS